MGNKSSLLTCYVACLGNRWKLFRSRMLSGLEMGFCIYTRIALHHHTIPEKRTIFNALVWLTVFCIGMLASCGVPELPYAIANPDYLNLLDQGPCWNNICPEQTSVQEAETILGSLSIANEVYKTKYEKYIGVDLDDKRFGVMSTIRLNYSDLTISQIEIIIREKGLTLLQVIEYLGQPTYITKVKSCNAGDIASPLYNFVLWYKEKGVTISMYGLYTYQATDLIVESNLGVYKIVYHVSNSSVENWPQLANLGWNEEQVYLDNLHPWPGWDGSIPSYIDTCE